MTIAPTPGPEPTQRTGSAARVGKAPGKSRSSRRAWVLIDAAIGLGLVSVMMVAMAHVVGRQQRFARAMAESRAATRVAESALTELQTGRFAPDGAAAGGVEIRTIA